MGAVGRLRPTLPILILCVVWALVACGPSKSPVETSNVPEVVVVSPPPPQPIPLPVSMDCTGTNLDCPEISIAGDAPQNSKFHGMGDPTIRKDPNTGVLWMAYSWPNIKSSPVATVSDIHLAQSTDNGTTWTYSGPLWTAQLVTNPVSGASNYKSHEVVSIWPENRNGTTVWHSIHFEYYIKPGNSIYSQIGSMAYFVLTSASSPTQLSSQPETRMGFGGTNPKFGYSTNLSSLSPDLAKCQIWNEPAYIMKGGKLYLAVQCMIVEGGEFVHDKYFYAMFSTLPQGSADTWTWNFLGKFAGYDVAQELDNHRFIVEMELAERSDGTIVAIMTPSDAVENGDVHFGCRALELESLDTPKFVRDSQNKLKVLAQITASDLSNQKGPGACAYEPSSNLGIIFVRKLWNDAVLGYFWTMHKTGLLIN